MPKTAFLFPGQGSQYVGMGADLYERFPEARAVFDEAEASSDVPLRDLMFGAGGNPEAEQAALTQTDVTQPALYVHSLAAFAVLESKGRVPDMTAGHSLGEYSALAAVGALGFAKGLRLVRLRGQLMARAGDERPGAMAAVLGMEVSAYDPIAPHLDRVARPDDLAAALAQAEIVSLHVPLSDATAHLVDARFLAALPERALLVNTARGELVNETALLDALRSGRLAGAALDVFEREPPDPANPLLSEPRAIITPHVAALTEQTADEMARLTAQNAIDGLDGQLDPDLVANPETLP